MDDSSLKVLYYRRTTTSSNYALHNSQSQQLKAPLYSLTYLLAY